jgi:amino acid permease
VNYCRLVHGLVLHDLLFASSLSLGGWLSLILIIVITIEAFYSGLLMQRCMDVDSDIRTYPDIGNRAFGYNGRLLVSVFMYVELYLVATGFLILEGDNLSYLFLNTGIEITGIRIEGKQIFVIDVAVKSVTAVSRAWGWKTCKTKKLIGNGTGLGPA